MALQKEITQENGIVLSYHRIESLNILTNVANIISVSSYLNRNERENELKAYEEAFINGTGVEMNVYINSNIYKAPYNPSMTIEEAYDYLKTLKAFEGAEDV